MKVHSTFYTVLLLLLLATTGLAPTATAQSVDAVIDNMKAHYQAQLATVDTYIIETDTYTSYHRKTTRNGEEVYESETQWSERQSMFDGFGATDAFQPGPSQLDTLALHARYAGTETVEGRETHVLLVDDPSALSGESGDTPDDMEGEMKLYIDADQHVPLLMEYTMQVEQDGQTQTMNPRIFLRDYRTVDGFTMPWKMEMIMENLNASISPEEREEARKGLEEMEARMAEMPEEQRKMMEGMMENQLEQLRKVLDEGTINFSVNVQDVQVNAPIPDGVFDE